MSWLKSVFNAVTDSIKKDISREKKVVDNHMTNVYTAIAASIKDGTFKGTATDKAKFISDMAAQGKSVIDGKLVDTSVANVANTSSVYTQSDSLVTQIAKAIGLNVNLGADGKVTGSLSAGTSASPAANAVDSISAAFAKYWWILVIVVGAVLIFRPGRRR